MTTKLMSIFQTFVPQYIFEKYSDSYFLMKNTLVNGITKKEPTF